MRKKIREKEALEQKLVSCRFLNNKQKILLITVVFKFILEVMKVLICWDSQLVLVWAKGISKIIYLVEFFNL